MLYEDNFLAHHGIKGQRWGIRRFQNEDGTLTTEGKERYGKYGSVIRKASDEYDAKVKKGAYTDDPDVKDVYIMEQVDKYMRSSIKRPKGLSEKESKIVDRVMSGEVVDEETIRKISNDHSKQNPKNEKEYGDYQLLNDFVYDQLPAMNRENAYRKEIAKETDQRYIDPSFRKFNSKDEKAKAEADYLERIWYGHDRSEMSQEESRKFDREIEHIFDRVAHLSMDGYFGSPRSERMRSMYDYQGYKNEFENLWEPKYKQSEEYKNLQAQREKLKDETGYNAAREAINKIPVGKKKSFLEELKEEKIWMAFNNARKKYDKETSEIKNREEAMKDVFRKDVCKNVLLDIGYEVTADNIDLIRGLIWHD